MTSYEYRRINNYAELSEHGSETSALSVIMVDEATYALDVLADHIAKKRFANDLIGVGLIENPDVILDFPGDARHILIGDSRTGGGHHLESMLRLNVADRLIASEVHVADDRSTRSASKLRGRQKVKANGQYRVNVVIIGEKNKQGGSSMFPDEWSAEDILDAVMQASITEPYRTLTISVDGDNEFIHKTIHRDVVRDVRIQTVVDHMGPMYIQSAYPY